jgi:hypothetical protein
VKLIFEIVFIVVVMAVCFAGAITDSNAASALMLYGKGNTHLDQMP